MRVQHHTASRRRAASASSLGTAGSRQVEAPGLPYVCPSLCSLPRAPLSLSGRPVAALELPKTFDLQSRQSPCAQIVFHHDTPALIPTLDKSLHFCNPHASFIARNVAYLYFQYASARCVSDFGRTSVALWMTEQTQQHLQDLEG